MPKVVSIVGKSKSGKTSILEKVIRRLKERGYKVGTIKHSFSGFDIDKKGKDTWRHKHAGASAVAVVAKDNLAFYKDCENDNLENILPFFSDMDIILVEGYKNSLEPKIEVFNHEKYKKPLFFDIKNVIAMVTDSDISLDIYKFKFNEIDEITKFIEDNFF